MTEQEYLDEKAKLEALPEGLSGRTRALADLEKDYEASREAKATADSHSAAGDAGEGKAGVGKVVAKPPTSRGTPKR